MKTDHELLELAAKATGIYLEWDGPPNQWQPMFYEGKTYRFWNPLTDDGDALRLAVKLKIYFQFFDGFEEIIAEDNRGEIAQCGEVYCDDMYAAARRVIVRVAAEIGESMNV